MTTLYEINIFDCCEGSLLRLGIFIHLGKPSRFLIYEEDRC